MNKELREILNSIQAKKEEAKNLLKEGKKEEVKALILEIEDLQDTYEVQNKLFEQEKEIKQPMEKKNQLSIEVQAFKNAILGKPLTEEMKAALVTSVDVDGGFLVPKEISTQIIEAKRQYVSLKDIVRTIPVKSASGSLAIEDSSAMTELVDFDETNPLAVQQPKFKNVSFALKNKGAVTPISNALLQDETAGLPEYMVNYFARKAVRTENKDILAALKNGKTAVQLTNVASLKKSINKDIDPALLVGGAIITNQDGYNHLDQEVDSQGRPVLQADVKNSDVKLFKGLPVIVLSNAELATTGTTTKKAPVFYGNFFEGGAFFDREVYEVAVSKDAMFTANQTAMRIVERYDAKQLDSDAFVYGELDVTATV